MDLGDSEIARLDFEELVSSPLNEIKPVVEHLREVCLPLRSMVSQNHRADSVPLAASWRERKKCHELLRTKRTVTLSVLEELLVDALSRQPMRLDELATALYGTKLFAEHVQDRVKKLVRRLRQKWSGLVVQSNGQYKLAD